MDAGTTAAGWRISRPPQDRISTAWRGGRYESGRRDPTRHVEGRIEPREHLVMLTFAGGAERHVFRTDDGGRFDGRDRAGAVSFLPAGCGRDLALENVAWHWGAVAVDLASAPDELVAVPPFSAAADPFLSALIGEMDRLLRHDGALDATWCSHMTLALCHYLLRSRRPAEAARVRRLAPWQLRATLERIEAGLSGPIRIADLAAPLGLSEGHFFRAFQGSTGRTPLEEITTRRVDRAAALLRETHLSLAQISQEIGFASQSHLARVFRARHGTSPSAWRNAVRCSDERGFL